MANQSPAPETVIAKAMRVALRSVRVALPGRIQTYDASTCQADVQPLIQEAQADFDGTVTTGPLPVVPHVPVLFMGGGGNRTTYPVKPGDTCLLIFSSSSLDRWLALGGLVDPQDDRRHDISDGIALVGLTAFPNATPASTTATVLEGLIQLGSQSASAPVALNTEFAQFLAIFTAWILVPMMVVLALKDRNHIISGNTYGISGWRHQG